MAEFKTEVSESGEALKVVIALQKFDAQQAAVFKEAVDQVWTDAIKSVAIDFAEVKFIDSSGIGALLSIQKKLGPGSDPLVIQNASKNVIEVIELLRLHRVFRLDQP